MEERNWDVSWRQPQQLFAVLPGMLEQACVEPGSIDLYAAGLGPGSFSGCRVAVSASCAFAVPDGRSVFGVSSGEAIAHTLFAETTAESVVVVGDARRQHVWLGHFARGEMWPTMTRPWSLRSVDLLSAELGGVSAVVSPDWDRLAPLLKEACPAGTELIETVRFPAASVVGLLAFRKKNNNCLSEPLAPIYLHPAVRREGGEAQ